MIQHAQGNILESQCDALVNPINCTPAMGAGLALQFREAVHGLYASHQALARAGAIQPGRLTLFHWAQRRQTIVGVPTKRHWKDRSLLEDVEAGILELRRLMDDTPALQSIAIPPLGCGLGGLNPKAVRSILEEAFRSSPKQVTLFGF